MEKINVPGVGPVKVAARPDGITGGDKLQRMRVTVEHDGRTMQTRVWVRDGEPRAEAILNTLAVQATADDHEIAAVTGDRRRDAAHWRGEIASVQRVFADKFDALTEWAA